MDFRIVSNDPWPNPAETKVPTTRDDTVFEMQIFGHQDVRKLSSSHFFLQYSVARILPPCAAYEQPSPDEILYVLQSTMGKTLYPAF